MYKKLIVGLGNPGTKFDSSRHNLGFMVLESLVKELTPVNKHTVWESIDKPKSLICKLDDVIFLKPQTYMNLSGLAVSFVSRFYKIGSRNIWVIHDEIDLPFGKLRIRRGGGSAGHNGIESIMKDIADDLFVRFRLGIGGNKKGKDQPERNLHKREVEKYVLSPFTTSEAGDLRKAIKKTVEAVKVCLEKGIDVGMNRYN